MSDWDKIARLIAQDHERLEALLAEISSEIAGEPPAPFDQWKLLLWRQLRDLQNQLRKHFDLEEHGGFLEDVVRQAPRFFGRVDALVNEHEEILRRLDRILSDLKEIGTAAAWRQAGLREGLLALFAVLKEHEVEENSLLQETYFQDLGVGD